MLDPFIVTTVIAGVAAIGLGCERIILKARLASNFHRIFQLTHTRNMAWSELDKLRMADQKRRNHLRSISKLGHAAKKAKRG